MALGNNEGLNFVEKDETGWCGAGWGRIVDLGDIGYSEEWKLKQIIKEMNRLA